MKIKEMTVQELIDFGFRVVVYSHHNESLNAAISKVKDLTGKEPEIKKFYDKELGNYLSITVQGKNIEMNAFTARDKD